ncbi:MAG TPA: PQQ-binding-like beta-propeller repeat protein [Candidatus Saccharimonadales bacterium]|nr:PQQ-binding-like beta-propeller repeat protein [Candidatus Saccharimonadales bacterium]
MKRLFPLWIAGIVILSKALPVFADNWPQWRGPQRDGISRETGLLGEWPKEGPNLLWRVENIGRGYSTPAVVNDRLYLMASEGLDNEFVEALDVHDGKRMWSTRIGNVGNPKQQPNFPTARSTPTVEGDFLYALSSDGDLDCMDIKNGSVRWKKNLRSDFGGKTAEWAYAESPLIDGEALVCAPGGSEATVVALGKTSGDLIWKCPLAESDDAGFSSAIVVDTGEIREYVRLLTKGLVGIEASTGRLLWRYGKPISKYGANIQTPVASGEYVFCSSTGTGGGVVRLKVQGKQVEAEQVYFGPEYQTAIGGVVKVGDYLYGTTGEALLCTEFTTGQVKWKERALGAASLCYADGRLYIHGENGDIAMIEPSPESYREKGRFTPTDQPQRANAMEKAWAYPVVSDGRLYIRDNNVLWCYAVGSVR